MHQIIRNCLDASEFARSIEELQAAVTAVASLLDCHKYAYLTLPCDPAEVPYLFSNYDVRWTTPYLSRRYDLRDPVPRLARRATELFDWTPEIVGKFDPSARVVFSEAEAFDIRCGVTVPLRHRGRCIAAMTFVTDVRHTLYRSCLPANAVAFQFLAQHSHDCLKRLREPGRLVHGVEFTRRELECLEWASQGKSRTDIGAITGLTYRQVSRALERVKSKLGVRTTTQAARAYAALKKLPDGR